jgi:hypothetical protein
MFALRIFCGSVAMLALAAFTQPTQPALLESTRVDPREPVRDAETQQRRALLRASLKSQPDVAVVRETTTGRLLSDQERADLRQQLRQQ